MRIPVELQNEIVGDNVVLFVGAGFVKNYMGSMPTWTELLVGIFEKLTGKKDGIFDYCTAVYDQKGKRVLPPGEYLRVAQQFELAREVINQQRAESGLDPIDGIHRLIQTEITAKYRKEEAQRTTKDKKLMALTDLPFSTWVTTNYDTFLEDLFFAADSGRDIIIDRPARNIDFRPNSGGRVLLKIHGSIKTSKPEASIVITEDDYHRFIRQDRYLTNKLYTLFCERTVIFLGYGLSDPNIQFIYNEVLFDQKRSGGDQGRSFSQVRPTYFISRDKIAQSEKTYYTHKRINYIDDCGLEDFFADVIAVFEGFKRSQLSVKDRIEGRREYYDKLFSELVTRSEEDLSQIAAENRQRSISFIFDLIELYKLNYVRGSASEPAYKPYDLLKLSNGILKGIKISEAWIEDELSNGKLDLYLTYVKLFKGKLSDSNGWMALRQLEKQGGWLIKFGALQDRDRLAQDYCRQLVAFDNAFNGWSEYKFCLERYVEITGLFKILDEQTKELIVEKLYLQLLRCGRGFGDSWYSTEKVYECWGQFSTDAWPYLKIEILKHGEVAGGKLFLDSKSQAMLNHLAPGADPLNFLPRA